MEGHGFRKGRRRLRHDRTLLGVIERDRERWRLELTPLVGYGGWRYKCASNHVQRTQIWGGRLS